MSEEDSEPKMPLPIVQATDQEAGDAAFGPSGGPDPSTPVGAAMLWWMAVGDPQYEEAFENLSANPTAWGDASEVVERIGERSIATHPIQCDEDPNIAYVKFIEYAGDSSGMVFEEAPLDDVEILTMVKDEQSGWWLVWGLSHNHLPPPDQVYGRGEYEGT